MLGQWSNVEGKEQMTTPPPHDMYLSGARRGRLGVGERTVNMTPGNGKPPPAQVHSFGEMKSTIDEGHDGRGAVQQQVLANHCSV